MKILDIRFKNINTLKGEWEIRFDQSPLSEAGIFAITGPNGAGKTTILDAISLALYGETARLKNPGDQIISHEADDAYAIATISVAGSVYRSEWSVYRTGGRISLPEMRLYQVNGEEALLEDKISRVRLRIAEVTGLDFKRFCRSIMLAQGEFAAFLHALGSERAEILEKIVGTEVYDDFVRSVHEQADTEKERLLQLKEEFEELPAADTETIHAAEESVSEYQTAMRETEQDITRIRHQQKWLENVGKLENAAQNSRVDLAAAQSRREAMADDLLRLKKAENAEPLAGDLGVLETRQQEADALQKEFASVRVDIPLLKEKIRTLGGDRNGIAVTLEQAETELARRKDAIGAAESLDREIASEEKSFREKVAQYETLEREQQENLSRQNQVKQELAVNEEGRKNVADWLEKHADEARLETVIPEIQTDLDRLIEIRKPLGELRAHQEELRKAEKKAVAQAESVEAAVAKIQEKLAQEKNREAGAEQQITELLDGAESMEALEQARRERKQRIWGYKALRKVGKKLAQENARRDRSSEQIAAEREALQKEKDAIAGELAGAERIREALEEAVVQQVRVAQYESERQMLVPGEACPLCGSTEHPYVNRGLPYEGEPKQTLKEQDERIREFRKQIADLDSRMAKLEQGHQKMEVLQAQWDSLTRESDEVLPVGDTAAIKAAMQTRKAEIKTLKRRIRSIRSEIKKAEKSRRKQEKIAAKMAEQEAVAEGYRQRIAEQVNALAAVTEEIQAVQTRETSALDTLREKLTAYDETPPEAGREGELIGRLTARLDRYREYLGEQASLAAEEQNLRNQVETLPEELRRHKKEADALEGRIRESQERLAGLKEQRTQSYGTSDPVQERQQIESRIAGDSRKLAAVTSEIEKNRQKLRTQEEKLAEAEAAGKAAREAADALERELKNRAMAAGFRDLDDVRRSRLSADEKAAIKARRDERDREVAELAEKAEEKQKAFEAERARQVTDVPLEELARRFDDARKQRETMEQELIVARSTLKQQAAMEQAYQEKLEAVEEQEKAYERLEAERQSIGAADTPEVRRRVQEMLLDRLLEQSNQYLGAMSGRYYLRQNKDGELGLEVEDLQQNSVRRVPGTLSGGESFMLSLALALGLSDMASEKRKIESLFLDEGFGSLDEENLYKVIATLKNLKANGKMIGIISHVKKLEDEIPTQIRLRRQTGGVSRLELVA